MDNNLDIEIERFSEGTCYTAYRLFGVHADGNGALTFRVWAPDAECVHLVGDFNDWNISAALMECIREGVYEITLKDIPLYSNYKYAVTRKDGSVYLMADPYAFHAETNGGSASKVWFEKEPFKWEDEEYLEQRHGRDSEKSPVNIYEVHAAGWRRCEDGSYYDYEKLSLELVPYVKDMGYTHIEFMPLMEYSNEDSLGYETTGYFALTSRFGTPEGFMKLVNQAHKAGVGVILDWSAGKEGEFDYLKGQVRSFILSSAMYLLKECHADGLRIGNLIAFRNEAGDTILKSLSEMVRIHVPDAIICAAGAGMGQIVTKEPCEGGLGLDYMWNDGWTKDTLSYISTDLFFRKQQHNRLTFPLSHAYSERHLISVSHKDVGRGLKSLIDKMPGEYEEKFAGLRGFMMFFMSQPGKKLIFMGSEFGQFDEWDYKRGLEWNLLDYETHKKTLEYVKDLNYFYLEHPQLWEIDSSWKGFQWINAEDSENSVISYWRIAFDGSRLMFVVNFSGSAKERYRIDVPDERVYKEIINSDEEKYGGSGMVNPCDITPVKYQGSRRGQYIEVNLPPFGAVVLE